MKLEPNIKHYQLQNIEEYLQATAVVIEEESANVNLLALYYRPEYNINKRKQLHGFS